MAGNFSWVFTATPQNVYNSTDCVREASTGSEPIYPVTTDVSRARILDYLNFGRSRKFSPKLTSSYHILLQINYL
jgi:hypothetical protein